MKVTCRRPSGVYLDGSMIALAVRRTRRLQNGDSGWARRKVDIAQLGYTASAFSDALGLWAFSKQACLAKTQLQRGHNGWLGVRKCRGRRWKVVGRTG